MKSIRCAAALAAVAILSLAGCVTSNTIDGHQVRGTAAPETPVEEAAREFDEHVGKIVADAYGDDPQIQAEIRKLRADRAASEDPANLHRDAPGWMHRWWADYRKKARGGYAIFALDRNGYGAGYVYCTGGGCRGALSPGGKSYRDVNFKHGAIKLCKQHVRENYPAERPHCAIYAIKDKIVWKGRLPWERGRQ